MIQLRQNVSTIPGKSLINMPTLVVTREDIMVKELELKQGELIIGRDDDCDLILNDNSISNHHAKIITLFNATYIEDMSSTNGTFVNGKQVKERILHDGDIVTVGKRYRILFEKTSNQVSEKGDKTTVMNCTEMNNALTEFARKKKQPKNDKEPASSTPVSTIHTQSETEAVPDAGISSKASLRIMAGKLSGREMPLNRRSTRLSRSGLTHANVKRNEHGYYLQRDAGAPENSKILLNDVSISAEAILLTPGDVINLNGILLEFQTG